MTSATFPHRPIQIWPFLLVCVFFFTHCKKEDPISENPPPLIEQEFPIVYQAEFPDGKLPYPHHNPTYSQEAYDSLVNNLFIINNYGLYQCGDTKEDCYFHDGLDFVLDNGTPIFALEPGKIRSNIGGDSYYRTLVIEDEDEPGYAWAYTHVYDFVVNPGESVSKGQFLGVVNFQGLGHIHLDRIRLREEGAWNKFSDLIHIYPDEYFTFKDEIKPIIKKPFHYFKNASDIFTPSTDGVDTISGDIDLVVSIRDVGAYAGAYIGNNGYWGDRLAVRDVSYRILKDGVEILSRPSYDFTKIEFVHSVDKWRATNVVFKHRPVVEVDISNFNKVYSHYILTNARDDLEGLIQREDSALSWNTEEIDDSGQAKYPNGLYQVEITAHDSNGNEAVEMEEVFIRN